MPFFQAGRCELAADHSDLREMQATPERRVDLCNLSLCRRIAAMLDGDALPRGWHFPLMAGETRRSKLRADGFPGFGLPMPDLGLPRLLLLGRTVDFHVDLAIGASVERLSMIEKIQSKETAIGPSAIITIRHELRIELLTEPAIVEAQTYMLLGSARSSTRSAERKPPPSHDQAKVVTPDETMLFQYSALGFNSHKIHLDRGYARDVEGLPDLVINGGLITLLLMEFLRNELGSAPRRITTRHVAPLFCNRPVTLTASRDGDIMRLAALDDAGLPATTMEALLS
jgi:3-methylfumaryl-CoA hydratase